MKTLQKSHYDGNDPELHTVEGSDRFDPADFEPATVVTSVALLVRQEYRDIVFSAGLKDEIEKIAGGEAIWVDPDDAFAGAALAETEVIFSTWGMPRMDAAFLEAAPKLRAVLYAAGSPKIFVTPESFARGIIVSTAVAANAIPVAEFAIASIILSLKRVWQTMRETHKTRIYRKPESQMAGGYQTRVGLVSLGMIGSRVAVNLASTDLEVLAYDPFVSPEEARRLNVRQASLEEIFETCDAVSLHTPMLPSTTGMIGGALLSSMKQNATLINTARGGIICERELCRVLAERPDLTALLDVAESEPPVLDSPLWELPNVFLTPHISGSLSSECRRMGRFMVDEFRRLSRSVPLMHQVVSESLPRVA